MVTEILRLLGWASLASVAAMLLVALLGAALRRTTGARAACQLWWLVPTTTLAAMLPTPRAAHWQVTGLHGAVPRAAEHINAWIAPADSTSALAAITLGCWLLGCMVMIAGLLYRQRRQLPMLGVLTNGVGRCRRSALTRTPMVIGVWRPILVLPVDFESRYSSAERALILAHERAHIARADPLVIAIAAAWVCLFWFNPLVYWAIRRLRLDQERACDALALEQCGEQRGRYAATLLKAQLDGDDGWMPPMGCRWISGHPLKARIDALKHPLPSRTRSLGGTVLVIAMTAAVSYSAWTAELNPVARGSLIAVDIDWTVDGPTTASNPNHTSSHLSSTGLLVGDGEGFSLTFPVAGFKASPLKRYEERCKVSLPHQNQGSALARDLMAKGVFVNGTILLECRTNSSDARPSAPSLLVKDGTTARIDSVDADTASRSTIWITASTAVPGATHGH